jgi:hypothetical protein
MINGNDKVYRCKCQARGQMHFWTTDASGKHMLLVDPSNVHLLRDTSWTVGPMLRLSTADRQGLTRSRLRRLRRIAMQHCGTGGCRQRWRCLGDHFKNAASRLQARIWLFRVVTAAHRCAGWRCL